MSGRTGVNRSATRWMCAAIAALIVGLAACQDDPLSPDLTEPTLVGAASVDCKWDFFTNQFRCPVVPGLPSGPPPAKAWVYSNDPWVPDYAPERQYNSSGKTNRVRKLGRGRYEVSLPGIWGKGGIVHVTAAAGSHQCALTNWGPSGSEIQVRITCRSTRGWYVDGAFTMLYYREQGRNDRRSAYFFADGTSAPSDRGHPNYGVLQTVTERQWSSLGGPMWFSATPTADLARFSVSFGAVTFSLREPPIGVVLATAANGQGHCWPPYYHYRGQSGLLCPGGATTFTVSAIGDPDIAGFGHHAAYASISRPVRFLERCSEVRGRSTSMGKIELCDVNLPGTHLFRFHGITNPSQSVVIASMGGGEVDDYCNVESWAGSGSITLATVKCYDKTGRPLNPPDRHGNKPLHGTIALFTNTPQ